MIEQADLSTIQQTGVDAIVVGGGAAGGLAAELLTQGGLRTLVLDAGWRAPFWQVPFRRLTSTVIGTLADPRAMKILPPSMLWRGQQILKRVGRIRQPIQSRCYAWETAPEGFVDDLENPYETPPGHPFAWIRARQLGGRMIIPAHGRQYLRHGAQDFAPLDDLSPAWPFAPGTLDPWYELVERKLNLSGGREGTSWVPDSLVGTLRTPSADEAALIAKITTRFPAANAMLGRFAPPRNTLAAAAATGKLLCRKGAIVRHVETDAQGRVTGVVFYDRQTRKLQSVRAPVVFLCAATLETTRILLLSKRHGSDASLGASSNALGRHLMDHVSIKVQGTGPALSGSDATQPMAGSCIYLPRFDGRNISGALPTRGFGMRIYQTQGPPGISYFTAVSDAEMLPRATNRVTLATRTDAWGIPILSIDCTHSEGELALAHEQAQALRDVADIASIKISGDIGKPGVPGSAIHECGTARMGTSPDNSVVGPFNECWDAEGLYITDGACFPSEGLQNPTLTIMALTARACGRITG